MNQRLALTFALCALIGLAALVEHLAYGHHVALATETGPEWIQDGVTTDRLAWSQATRVLASPRNATPGAADPISSTT